MMGYLSLLVEKGIFEEIDINFLLVGHTHGSLDQQFSVYSKKIKSRQTKFIGSRMALHDLLRNAYQSSHAWKKPTISKQIQVVYDFKAMLLPCINKSLKYYQYPHVFRIKNVLGKAVMQYKMFSTYTEWLPTQPLTATAATAATISAESSVDIDLGRLLNDAQDKLLRSCGLSSDVNAALFNDEKRSRLQSMASLAQSLNEMERKIVAESITRHTALEDVPKQYSALADDEEEEIENGETDHENEDDGSMCAPATANNVGSGSQKQQERPEHRRYNTEDSNFSANLKDITEYLSKHNSSTAGFIVWLKQSNKQTESYLDLLPNPIFPSDILRAKFEAQGGHGDDDNDDEEIDDEAPQVSKESPIAQVRNTKSLWANAKSIVSTCKIMLKEIDYGVIGVDENMEANTYCYHQSKLSKNEREFYEKRSTMEGLIDELDREVAHIRNVPYSFIDECYFGGEAHSKRQEHEEKMKKFLEDSKKLIERSGYEAGPNEEVISRPKKTIKRTTKVLTIFVVVFSNNNLIFSSV